GSSAGSRVKPGMTCQIAEVLSHDRILFKGITDRTEAEKLAGSEIWIKRSDFQEADSDELYLADLMGYEAKDINGKNLGKVTGFSQGAQLLVELDNQLLIPFVKPIWVSINEEAKELIFDLPEGFFDA
ncbi:MAG: 16S rRNA processing protein RimM, partial [Deltaproteobacteria bacterium]|nr:16S rRNA processing protein RimM [Deltaproteobacteria bacterium]